MADRFDEEFYSSAWRRVLPLGPDGIQPYVRTSRASQRVGLVTALGRLIATMGAMVQDVIAFGRLAAIGTARRPILVAAGARAERPLASLRLAHEAGARERAPWLRPDAIPGRLSSSDRGALRSSARKN